MRARTAGWSIGAVALAIAAAFVLVPRLVPDEARLTVDSPFDERTKSDQAIQSPPDALTPPSPESSSESRRAASDSPSGKPSAAKRQRLTIQVQDPDGTEVSGAAIAIFHGDSVLDSGRTDSRGALVLDGGEGSGEYALLAPGWAFARGAIELGSGERLIALVDDLTIAGRVLVDGAPPTRSMELSFDRGIPPLPTAVFQALGGAVRGQISLTARTQADGGFSFRGLHDTEPGEISWQEPYFMEAGKGTAPRQSAQASAPQGDLFLRLVEGLEVRLRVVDGDGNPVPGAPVSVSSREKDPLRDQSATRRRIERRIDTVADFEARYARAILPSPEYQLVVEVALAGGTGARKYTPEWPVDPRGIFDLGDLSVATTRNVNVLVQDELGNPIHDAIVRAWPSAKWPEAYTDASGRIVCRLETDDEGILVTLQDYLSEFVRVPQDAVDAMVSLRKSTILEFEIATDSQRMRDLNVSLTADGPIFQDEGSAGERLRVDEEARRSGISVDKRRTLIGPNFDGRWIFNGVAPNQALHAVLQQRNETELSSVDVAPLFAGEHRRVALRLDDEGKSLRVRVLGPDHARLSRAIVSVPDAYSSSGGGRWSVKEQRVDDAGEAEIVSIYGDRAILLARAEGFASKSLSVHPIPSGVLEIVLEKTRSIEVELVSPDGKLIEEDQDLEASPDGLAVMRGIGISRGRYRIDGLPAGMALLTVAGPAGKASLLHDTRQAFARMVVGDQGMVIALVQRTPDRLGSMWALAIAAPGGPDRTRVELRFDEADRAGGLLEGLPLQTWEVWLELRSEEDLGVWTRVGSATTIVLDPSQPRVKLELRAE
ncbi:MAG: Ig-like domain-containing protein [Planctomycetota bacterium]